MKIRVVLETRKGLLVHMYLKDFQDIHCMSDANQQLPHTVIQFCNRIFGFHNIASGHAAIYRERMVLE